LPVWSLAIFGRGAWAPDEAREYDITLNMLHDADYSIPHMAGAPFLEKPPLLYWTGAAAMALTHVSLDAARAQNLLWSVITVLSIGLLAQRMSASACGKNEQSCAGLNAALFAGTTLLLYEIQIWYSTDAPLLAATALAWLSAWSATHTDESGKRLGWYALFAVALTTAFFAKNLFGWVTPGLGLLLWTVLEKRWKVFREPGLYIALAVVCGAVALWMWDIIRRGDGTDLTVLLRDNTLGRFHATTSESGYEFGHRNHPFRFLLLLPVFAVPWTFCVIAALRWSYGELRRRAATASAIRFCLCAFIAGISVLMVSATARDTYFGPSILAMCPLLGLWSAHGSVGFAQWIQRAHRYIVVIASSALVLLALLVAFVLQTPPDVRRIALGLALGSVSFAALHIARSRLLHGSTIHEIRGLRTWFAALFTILILGFPAIDVTENLAPLAREVQADIVGTRTALFCADETTLAALDSTASLRFANVCNIAEVTALLREHPQQLFLARTGVVRMPLRAESLLELVHMNMWAHSQTHGAPSTALEALGLRPLIEWSAPGGRSYALYAQPSPLASNELPSAAVREIASRY
jgi:4-amino-4-deoxy-L-arabinose transferase-like glycosyltransferase